MENKRKKFDIRFLLFILGFLVIAVGVVFIRRYYILTVSHTSVESYEPGEWFELAPEGCVTADGSALTTRMRLGTENKVLVFFFGGGISLDENTAAHPYLGLSVDTEPGFYSANADDQIPTWSTTGLCDAAAMNPFRSWTIVIIPYTTADFHVGNAEFPYTAPDGSEAVLHHHGYENYRAVMDEAAARIGSQPEELLVAGWSAGGYGAAMLTEDLMQNYFPDAGHVTLCVDSSLLILDSWPEVFSDVWNVSEELSSKVETENLIVDFMSYLYDAYGEDMTFLYVGSVRDGALTKYQTYFDIGSYVTNARNATVYTAYLRVMVRQLQKKVPTIGIYLFDGLPYSLRPNLFSLTQHTILETRTVFWPLTQRTPVIRWLDRAVAGDVQTLGLELLR